MSEKALKESQFEKEVSGVINRFSQENASNTPDYILAQYLVGCLNAFNAAVQQRETWHGRDARPGTLSPAPVSEDVEALVEAASVDKCEGIFDRFEDYRTVTPMQAVGIERGWQDGKFGVTDHPEGVWLSLLVEEVGEAGQALNVAQFDSDRREAALDNLEVELIQVAALAVAWVESLRRSRKAKGK